jgi:PAS domain S-box-containing protein
MPALPIRVLLVDDDADYFDVTRALLTETSDGQFDLEWARDYLSALEAIKQSRYDVYLIDYRLGDRDGLDLLREGRAAGCRSPMIMLTGYGTHAVDVEAMKAGAADYLVKNQLSPVLLERTVRYALERARSIDNLRESEQRYRNLVETSPDGISLTDLDGRVLLANRQVAQMLGFTHGEDCLGQSLLGFIASEDRCRAVENMQKLLRSESLKNVEYTFLDSNGTRFAAEVSTSLVRCSDGKPQAVLHVIRDITERKRAEAERRLEEARAEALLRLSQMMDASLQEITRFALEEAVKLTRSQVGYLAFVNEDETMLTISAWSENTLKLCALPAEGLLVFPITETGLWGEAVRQRKAIITNDYAAPHPAKKGCPTGHIPLRRHLNVPVFDAQRIVVIAGVGNKEEPYDEFDVRQLTLLMDGMWRLLVRQRSDVALRKLSHAIEQAADQLVITNKDGAIEYVNPAFECLTGYSAAEVIGQTPRLLKSGLHEPAFYQELWQRIQAGKVFRATFINRKKNGELYYQEETITPVTNHNGVITHFVSTGRDITERKKAEQAIEKLAAFPRLNPNPVLEFAADGSLTYSNAAAHEMARCLGQADPTAILPPNSAQIVKTCLATGQSKLRLETVLAGRTISWSFLPIQPSQAVHCYASDITDRLNLEAQLRHSQKMESVGQLAAGVAHDFNNILTVIQGQTCLLLLNPKLDPKIAESLQPIRESAERAANLTRQLLALSRRQIMQPKELDLNVVISNVAKMLHRLLTESIALELHHAPHLPAILADPGMMEQIIVNLAVNARDAMPQGGQLTITTRALQITEADARINPEARPGQFVCLSVADTGCGMDAKIMERIFEPFFTTKEAGKGTGLGLATVYGIVKQHQGWIEVTSAVGQGSIFKVFLPSLGNPLTTSPESSVLPPVPKGSESVLVVEDEPNLCTLIKNILERKGYRVLTAASGTDALQRWEQQKGDFQLLLTDMVLPGGISGRELASRLQAQKPELKIIYTSGYSLELVGGDYALREGLNYLQKPFYPHVLAQTVRQCLDEAKCDNRY